MNENYTCEIQTHKKIGKKLQLQHDCVTTHNKDDSLIRRIEHNLHHKYIGEKDKTKQYV